MFEAIDIEVKQRLLKLVGPGDFGGFGVVIDTLGDGLREPAWL